MENSGLSRPCHGSGGLSPKKSRFDSGVSPCEVCGGQSGTVVGVPPPVLRFFLNSSIPSALHTGLHSQVAVNILAPELLFLILAHPVYKM